jgi:hypothetical protein
MALGSRHFFHVWRVHPHPARVRRHHGADKNYSGAKRHFLIAELQNMRSISLAGILLVVLGALALAYQGINYTRREKVLDVGPIHATKDTDERIPIPPLLGGLALVGGIVLLVAGVKQNA